MTESPTPRPPLDLDHLTAPAGWRVELVDATPSTNALAVGRAREGADPGLVVVTEPWTVDSGFITPTFKVKRNRIEEVYATRYETWVGARKPVVWMS